MTSDWDTFIRLLDDCVNKASRLAALSAVEQWDSAEMESRQEMLDARTARVRLESWLSNLLYGDDGLLLVRSAEISA